MISYRECKRPVEGVELTQDTALARALLAIAEAVPGGQTEVAEAIKCSPSTLSKWKTAIDAGRDVSIQKRLRGPAESYLMANRGEQFREGVRLVLAHARAALDDLERRFAATSADVEEDVLNRGKADNPRPRRRKNGAG